MAKKTREPKGSGKAPKKEKVKGPKVKGRLLDRVTNLTVVLFALSLVAEKVAG